MWSGSDLSIWHNVSFHACTLEINSNSRCNREHVEFCPSASNNIISPLPQWLCTLSLVVWRFITRESYSQIHMTLLSGGLARSCAKLKTYISTTIVSMTIKLGRLVTYLDGLLSVKFYNTLVSLQDQWQTKTVISLLPQYLCPPNLAGCWHIKKGIQSQSYMILQSRCFVRSCDKLNILYLHFHQSNSHQTWCSFTVTRWWFAVTNFHP